MQFLGFSNDEKGALRQEILKWSTVCNTFLRSGWSIVRSASLDKGGTLKKRLSPHSTKFQLRVIRWVHILQKWPLYFFSIQFSHLPSILSLTVPKGFCTNSSELYSTEDAVLVFRIILLHHSENRQTDEVENRQNMSLTLTETSSAICKLLFHKWGSKNQVMTM
jgi:hypothetical protein